ncbi:MAG: LytTR family transcriptional regulator DNA-binding domain-containing protein [Lachnospiraceae bacterium]|nr:LytTR family transcriptional regulator DNA-binding domain-containing protein [Lachnospiraceae bacterium]
MKDMVEIEVVLDERYSDPHVTIRTRSNTQQVENIICAIEDVSHSDFPQIAAVQDDSVVFVSQRDIVRVHTEGRKLLIQTENEVYTVKRTLAGLEDVLNASRFLRISQSEIINLYKVKSFDFNLAGTIGVEFDCGIKSWVSRSRVKQIKALLKQNSIKGG